MDTICINKDSSSELDESIRSMYAWYERATVCTVYLSETQSISELPHDSWFTRGWTLQELLAPRRLKFYSYNWDKLERWGADDKARLFEFIEQATTISSRELQHIARTPFSRRMQWATSREVTREEDMAYSLMGIFNVSISIAYGEGAERAFRRLLEEILKSNFHGALDLFNCSANHTQHVDSTSLIPSSPQQYAYRSTAISLHELTPLDPLVLTPRGIRIPVLLMPGISMSPDGAPYISAGQYGGVLAVSWPTGSPLTIPTTYCLLEKRVFGPDGYPGRSIFLERIPWNRRWAQLTFAVFNIEHCSCSLPDALDVPGIRLQPTCIAVVLRCDEHAGQVADTGKYVIMQTQEPVVFELKSDPNISPIRSNTYTNSNKDQDFFIPVSHLANHGMQLVNMYL